MEAPKQEVAWQNKHPSRKGRNLGVNHKQVARGRINKSSAPSADQALGSDNPKTEGLD